MKNIKSKKIGVLAGGPSNEREVSLKSGRAVYNALREEGYNVIFIDITDDDIDRLKTILKRKEIELAFIALHGRFGEDGTIQQLLEEMGLPYTGSGKEASRCALDKLASKQIFATCNIDIPPYRIFKKNESIEINDLGLPIVVKPQCEGSSIGLSIVREERELQKAVDRAYSYGNMIIIEKYIKGREITVGILDDKPLCVIQIVPAVDFYDYEAKYFRPDTKYFVPAPIKKQDYTKSQRLGKIAHMALRCRGFSRVDMILGDDGRIYVLEVNTIPGLTSRSLLPKAAEFADISFNELCERIVKLAVK